MLQEVVDTGEIGEVVARISVIGHGRMLIPTGEIKMIGCTFKA